MKIECADTTIFKKKCPQKHKKNCLQPRISKVFLDHKNNLTVGQNNFDNKIPFLLAQDVDFIDNEP